MREVDHARHDHVIMVGVIVEVRQIFLRALRRYFAKLIRQCEDLVAAGLNGARLMGADVARLGCKDALIGLQKCVDHDRICLRSSYKKLHSCLLATAGLPDSSSGRLRDLIQAVTRRLHHIGLDHPLHDRRVGSFCIIAGEVELFVHDRVSS